jgi:adenylosuccinate synthase
LVTVVALSGSVASGKSTLAEALVGKWGGAVLSTRAELERLSKLRGSDLQDRGAFQAFGDVLDTETDGQWVAGAAAGLFNASTRLLVVDAVRIEKQVTALRARFGRSLVHVHLVTTDRDELARRYRSRSENQRSAFQEFDSYDDVSVNPTEARIDSLAAHADVVLDTLRNTEVDLLVRTEARLGLLPSITAPLVDVLVGGQYGSEGKGNIAYYLAPEYEALVRVGGPNAGHRIKHGTDEHTHRSLPSGALANPGADLIIGPGAVLSPKILIDELRDTGVSPERVKIDPQVMIITEADVAAEVQLREKIRSTGQGVGAASARRILDRRLGATTLAKNVPELSAMIASTAELLNGAFEAGQRVLVEGTQGTGLSIFHGEYPWVTSRDTTVAGTLAEAGIGPRRVRRAIIVVRSYPIRVHGGSGPIGQGHELQWTDIESRSGVADTSTAELSSVTKQERRVAEFDWSLLRRSAELNSATDIALTFADYIDVHNRSAFRYEQLSPSTLQFVEEVESVTGATASLISTAFSERNIIDRRTWRTARR